MAVVADDGRHAEPLLPGAPGPNQRSPGDGYRPGSGVLRAPPLTPEQLADFRQRWDRAVRTAPSLPWVVQRPRAGLALTVTALVNRFKRWVRRRRRRFAR